ncbi:competence/damage-inducible protein A [Alteribacter lacisalsi]|uniref:Putative competence-damage inducible protein n=1 Tax=Alteribacter lacisalsi TaxID=2045244 RepID=A0A2W0HDN6_9BACI|nr:competence/damage-inducible protein A [Alteribacter lacisalsi]PYZ98080.1 competence/damage-inducible protein A [Alteribacter lacisalsi]
MKAEIIAVGSELLLGQITNSNARYLSEKMTEVGVDVYFHTAVGDNRERLLSVLDVAVSRSDLIILTGGLGPTKDDLTRETVADFIGKSVVMHPESLAHLESYFQKSGRPMTENNKKQAAIIEGAEVFPNRNGLACGMAVNFKKTFILLPGPPKELEPMVEKEVLPYLSVLTGSENVISSRVLRFFGIGESRLAEEIDDLIENQNNPTIAPLASDGEVTLRLTAKGDPEQNILLLDSLEEKIMSRAGTFFYGYDNSSLTGVTAEALSKRLQTVACAESLTGGRFGSMLTSVPGSSSFYKGGVICYDAKVKQTVLKVSEETFSKHGTVSARCAEELAVNVRSLMNSTVGISFTGVAGPDDLEGKEPGSVFIGIADESGTAVKELSLAGSRRTIRERAVKFGCWYLLKHIISDETTKE